MTRVVDSTLGQLVKTIQRMIEKKAEDIADGGCQDYASYREQVGIRRGLMETEDAIIELDKNIEDA